MVVLMPIHTNGNPQLTTLHLLTFRVRILLPTYIVPQQILPYTLDVNSPVVLQLLAPPIQLLVKIVVAHHHLVRLLKLLLIFLQKQTRIMYSTLVQLRQKQPEMVYVA